MQFEIPYRLRSRSYTPLICSYDVDQHGAAPPIVVAFQPPGSILDPGGWQSVMGSAPPVLSPTRFALLPSAPLPPSSSPLLSAFVLLQL